MPQRDDPLVRDLMDARAGVRDTNSPADLPNHPTLESWTARARSLRTRVLVSAGLWPMPEREPLCAHTTGRIEHDDYVIENVYFESWPGFFVTGNLYHPAGRPGPFPGVLCPHGHFSHGRLENTDIASIPGRCISLARQGYMAFAYDMIGYNDSGLQVGHGQVDHLGTGFAEDPGAYLWGISLLGLQLWNSIRAVDYLISLPEVDPDRIGCTGASGGGTQTFLLTAVDERIRVSAPVNMISAHFQGGCVCENAPGLRLDASNIEYGAMMAPRPMLMVSATGDWTVNTPTVEFPAVQRVYRLYGCEDRVATMQVDAGHNYNRASREAVYAWFAKWLQGIDDPRATHEQPFEVEPPERMLVFPDGRLPDHACDERSLVAYLREAAEEQIAALRPTNAATLQAYRETMGTAYRYALQAAQPPVCDLRVEIPDGPWEGEGYRRTRLAIGHCGGTMPAWLYQPANATGAVVVVHPEGKASLAVGDQPGPLVAEALARHLAVLAINVWGTGELAGRERQKEGKHFATYNLTDDALRVQDILSAVAYLENRYHAVHLVGLGKAGLWCLLARALALGVGRTVADVDVFPCDDDGVWADHLYIPLLRRAGDLRTAAALVVPGHLLIHNAAASFPRRWFRDAYGAAGARANLSVRSEKLEVAEILAYLAGEQ